jgi:hypothetical protein
MEGTHCLRHIYFSSVFFFFFVGYLKPPWLFSNDLFLVSHGELSVAAVSRQPTEDEITQTIFRELSALCSTANGLERQALSDEFLYKSNVRLPFLTYTVLEVALTTTVLIPAVAQLQRG